MFAVLHGGECQPTWGARCWTSASAEALGCVGSVRTVAFCPSQSRVSRTDLAIGKLERVMMNVRRAIVDLAKDRDGVAVFGTRHEGGLILDGRLDASLNRCTRPTVPATDP